MPTERAWVWATLKFGDSQIRTGHVLLAMLKTPALQNVLLAMSREFDKIKADQLADDFEQIVAGSPEGALARQRRLAARRSRRRRARRAARCRRRSWASRRRSSASPSI